jgi:hypothetical protein
MAEIKGTNVIAPVVPFSTDDVHPSHESRYGKGGYRTVATIEERDAIPAPRLEAGMLVHVVADGKAYQLGSDLTTWAEFTSGVSSWNDLQDKPTTFPPEAHSHAIADVSGLQTALDAKLALAGGSMNTGAAIDFYDGTTDAEVGAWGFGVELTSDTSQFAKVESTGLTVSSGGTAAVVVSGITTANDGYISGIMGWGDPSGTKWSDLNGTYVRTSIAVRPPAYTDGNQGMHTPVSGTYNYYLSNPISMGSPNSSWNGIAYFLAPGNRSGWGDANNDGQTDQPVNYWRLCVLCDWPFTYFTNPSSDPTTFTMSGWVPVSAEAPNGNEGAGYNGADYLPNYGGGFSVSSSGGSSHVSASAVVVTGAGGTTQLTPGHLSFPNSTQVMVGSFDNSTGGANGISLVCAVGYELNWQGGRVRSMQVGGDGTPVPIYFDSAISVPAAGITFAGDSTTQTTAWTGAFSYNDLDDLPTLFDGSYASLTNVPTTFAPTSHSHAWSDITSGVPSTFAPSAHKSSHATGGNDALTASDIGAAAASHTHALSSLTQSGASSGQVVGWNGSAWAPATPSTFSLPVATASVLGGVKQGSNTTIAADGTISVAAPVTSLAWSAITSRPTTLSGFGITDGITTSDSRLSDAREWTADTITQAEAEAGTATTRRAFTALRVFQAIAAWWNASAAKTKLDGIASGATANQTDAYLLSRANHTGTQAASTITGLATVATSGAYGDLTGRPTLGTAAASATGDFAAASHTHGNITNAGAIGSATGQIVVTTTSGVLTTAASIASSQVTGLPTAGTGASNYCAGNDSRLSDSRSPTSHASSHASGGSDAITVASSQVTGLAAVATSGSASDLSTGTVASARLSLALTTEARQMADAAKVLTVARSCESHEAKFTIDANQFNSATANGGTMTLGGAAGQMVYLTSGTTANGSVLSRIGTGSFLPWSIGSLASPNVYNAINFSSPKRLTVRFYRNLSSTNGVFRFQFGGKDVNSTTLGQLTNRGFGFEVRNRRVWLLAHNGTSLSQVDSSTDLATFSGSPPMYEATLTSDGAGNIALFLNGSSIATSTGGPTTDLTGTANPWGLAAEITNGGDTTQNQFYIWRPMILSGTF